MNSRATSPAVNPPPQPAGLVRSWVRFWFTPVDPAGLHVLRVLAGLLFLYWLLPFAGHREALCGLQGLIDRQAYGDLARLPDGMPPQLRWTALYFFGSDPTLLTWAYWLSAAVLVLFTFGIWTRLTGVLTWVIVASFTTSAAMEADADCLLGILAFYLMIGYVLLGQSSPGLSLAARLLGTWTTPFRGRVASAEAAGRQPSVAANLAVRLLQVHVALVVFVNGIHKLQFGDWWGGYALWFPLYPPFETTLAAAQAHVKDATSYMFLLSLAAYLTLAWQIGFPLFAWRPRWRPVLLGGAAVGWLGTAFLYRLPVFGPALFICCLSYLSPAEWDRLFALLGRVPGFRRLARRLPDAAEEPVEPEPRRKSVTPSVA
jgi:hypothetical protein